MKKGSLVELVNDKWSPIALTRHDVLPVKGKIYTIRSIFNAAPDGMGVLLDEMTGNINPYHNREQGFLITRFRELLPPMNVSIESLIEAEV